MVHLHLKASSGLHSAPSKAHAALVEQEDRLELPADHAIPKFLSDTHDDVTRYLQG